MGLGPPEMLPGGSIVVFWGETYRAVSGTFRICLKVAIHSSEIQMCMA